MPGISGYHMRPDNLQYPLNRLNPLGRKGRAGFVHFAFPHRSKVNIIPQGTFFIRNRIMERELIDRAEAIQQRILQLRDSL